MPTAGDPREKWIDRMFRGGLFTGLTGPLLVVQVHVAFVCFSLLSVLLLYWGVRLRDAVDVVVAKQELEARCKGGIPRWCDLYALLEAAREKYSDGRFTIIIDDRYQSPAVIPPGWDMSNVTICGAGEPNTIEFAEGTTMGSSDA